MATITPPRAKAFFFYAGPHPSGWTDFMLPKFTRQTPIVTADGRIITLSQEGLVVIRTFPSVAAFQTIAMPFEGGTTRAAASHKPPLRLEPVTRC